ncbi:hypothetical protein WG909_14960 [Peptostreptococcaceae bacterium AGR-M142]
MNNINIYLVENEIYIKEKHISFINLPIAKNGYIIDEKIIKKALLPFLNNNMINFYFFTSKMKVKKIKKENRIVDFLYLKNYKKNYLDNENYYIYKKIYKDIDYSLLILVPKDFLYTWINLFENMNLKINIITDLLSSFKEYKEIYIKTYFFEHVFNREFIYKLKLNKKINNNLEHNLFLEEIL